MDQATARAFDRGTQGQPVTKTATATSDKKDRRDNPIYASRELDEYGLTPNELRVYIRIARRAGEEGKCWESIPNMARAIGLGESTVRRCCQILALARLTSEQPIEGWTTERRINPISRWKNKAELPGIRDIVLRNEDKRAPVTRDRGITRALVTADGPPLSSETGAPVSPQQGLPLSPQTVEGIPSEGIPIEVNPSKVITHTQIRDDSPAEAIPDQPAVCVAIPIDLDLVRREYAKANSYPYSKKIRNPEGWLVSAQDGRYDDLLVLPWLREQEELAARREAEAEAAAARAYAELAAETERAAKAKAEWEAFHKEQAEEWERNAPQREKEQKEKLERERKNLVEECKRLYKHSASKPQFYAEMINMSLADNVEARAEYEEWLRTECTDDSGA